MPASAGPGIINHISRDFGRTTRDPCYLWLRWVPRFCLSWRLSDDDLADKLGSGPHAARCSSSSRIHITRGSARAQREHKAVSDQTAGCYSETGISRVCLSPRVELSLAFAWGPT